MHELSLAKSLIDQIVNLAGEHHCNKVTKASVLLGPFSGVVADSFDFGFNVLKKDQPVTEDALLVLETPPPSFKCLQCNKSFEKKNENNEHAGNYHQAMIKNCPYCNSEKISPDGGTELLLQQLEME